MWGLVLIASVGCYVLKLAGHLVSQSVLGRPRVRRIAALLPVALLAALVAVQTIGSGQALVVDARSQGLPQQPLHWLCENPSSSWWLSMAS